jgi:hypothetical protein
VERRPAQSIDKMLQLMTRLAFALGRISSRETTPM